MRPTISYEAHDKQSGNFRETEVCQEEDGREDRAELHQGGMGMETRGFPSSVAEPLPTSENRDKYFLAIFVDNYKIC